MTIDELLTLSLEEVRPLYAELSGYVASQCMGCSDAPMILSIKACKAMEEAHALGENPIQRLNEFLGTNVAEEELLALISTNTTNR